MAAASRDDAHAPLLREMFSVLLELRAHAEAQGAQLERVHAQLERLDARVSTLERSAERGATSARVRYEPAAATRERPLTLIDLGADALERVAAFLEHDNELAAALACRRLRDAVARADDPGARRRPLATSVRSLAGSASKLRWGVACAGAPLSAALFAHVAGLGDLRSCATPSEAPSAPACRGARSARACARCSARWTSCGGAWRAVRRLASSSSRTLRASATCAR